jgi:hypothetical protein
MASTSLLDGIAYISILSGGIAPRHQVESCHFNIAGAVNWLFPEKVRCPH